MRDLFGIEREQISPEQPPVSLDLFAVAAEWKALASGRPRETKSADDIRARRTANKRAQRARWIAARLCPTCGSEPAPCHTSCDRCLDAALARKAARKSAAGFSADDNLCSPY